MIKIHVLPEHETDIAEKQKDDPDGLIFLSSIL